MRSLGPAHRSFADPSRNILGSKLCAGATVRPNFFGFSFFYIGLDLFFCYFVLFLPSFLISSYSSLLILLFSPLLILLIQ